jgi:nickel-dependent lactate racemase
MTVIAAENPDVSPLSDGQIADVIAQVGQELDAAGRRVLVVIPDHTRTCPLGQIVRLLRENLADKTSALDFLIALGTHPPLSEAQIDDLLDIPTGRRGEVLGDSKVFNHAWKDPSQLETIGRLEADRIDEITGGLFRMEIEVTLNKLVGQYDRVLIAGPVFPHEVVGFSGGAKYFFPGICGQALLDFFHWLGAVITCPRIIGTKDTPVRRTLHAALDMVRTPSRALCMVVRGHELSGLFYGSVADAWSAAADLSSRVHIHRTDKPFDSVLAQAPPMYDELWVGAKCMYKMEPVVADGGELIIYAPHIREISATHGALIGEIGYHTRDYFLAQWDRFKDYPWGVLAHSTHVRGIGTYEDGVERPRIRVTLATGIPEETCRAVNLGYRDPETIDVTEWQGREDAGRLYVPKAGEMLYKLAQPPAWQTFGD